MAVLAIPAAGALLGGALFSWGATAMSVGWMLGSWLYGATSKSTTPGMQPQSMPMLNQALRGQPTFVTFGTNRVSSQIVWTKNWNSTRQGAGKSGGSGGGGKGGAAGSGSYTYFWDIIFHFGFFDVESYIKKGWNGGDALTQATIDAILAGHTVALAQTTNVFNHISGTQNQPKISLDFTECFYAPGFATGGADITSWSYFDQQEGVNCAWPYTSWLGFKQLSLGNSGVVPQLSFEIGPTNILDEPATFYGGSYDGTTSYLANGGFGLVDADGKHWVIKDGMNNFGFLIVCMEDNTLYKSYGLTSVRNDLTALAIPGLDTVTNFVIHNGMAAPINGTNQLYLIVWNNGDVFTTQVVAIRYNIATDGTPTVDGYHAYGTLADTTPSSGAIFPWHQLPTIVGSETIGGELKIVATQHCYASVGTGYYPTVISLSLTGTSVDFTPGTWEAQCLVIDTLGSLALEGNSNPLYRMNRVSIVPRSNDYSLILYKGSPDTAWASGVWATHSDPCVIWVDVTNNIPSLYRDRSADFMISLWDQGLDSTGAAGDSTIDDFSTPECSEGRITFARPYSDAPGTARIISFVYDAVLDLVVQDFDVTITYNSNISPAAGNEFTIEVPLDENNNFVIIGNFAHYMYFGSSPGLYLPTDVTPPYIIYRILTNSVWGFGFSASRIDLNSYNDVVAACEAQGILISVTYTTQDNFLAVIDELLSLYGGFLVDDAGTIRFGMVRSTDVPDAVVIDNSRLLSPGKGQPPVVVTRGAIQDGYNKVKFNYLDRNIDYKRNQVEIADEVDIDLNGPRVKEFPATYVMAGSLAQKIAEQALWTNLYARDTYAFKLGAKDAHRQPGDLITLVDSFHPLLRGGVNARIMKWKEVKRLEFDVMAVAMPGYVIDTTHDFTNITSADPGQGIDAPEIPFDFRMYELPKEFQGASAKLYVGYNQASAVKGAQLYLSTDGGASFVFAQDAQPFIISGILPDLENRPNGWCERDVAFYLMPGSSFNANSPTWAQTHDLDDVTQALRASGAGVIICGSEAMAWENLTLLGQNHYRAQRLYRGWGGTPISAHNSGSYFHAHGPGIFTQEISENQIGTSYQYKVVPYNFAGDAVDISSISAKSYSLIGLYWLPRVQPRAKTWVQSAINWPRSNDIGDRALFNTTSGGCDVTLTWPQAAQAEGFGAGGYGAGGFGHFAPDILTPSWRVNVYSSNGFSVRSSVVNTGFFTYDLVTNSTDFSGFAQNLWFRVTPFTVKGDGPVADVRTLKLFW